MQVMCVNPQPLIIPPSDVEKMKTELNVIKECFQKIESGSSEETTFRDIKNSVLNLNEIVLPVDNANDFFKIGGFNQLHPLLGCSNCDVVAATAELIADLCQNNKFCQSKVLDLNILSELVKLLDSETDSIVCSKALYALSSICRHNEESLKYLKTTKIFPAMMRILQASNDKIRTKAAFFLCYLASFEGFREAFYKEDVIPVLVQLLHEQDLSTEFTLNALSIITFHHKQSRIQCREERHDLKQLLLNKLSFYRSRSEFQECASHCEKILENCFQESRNE